MKIDLGSGPVVPRGWVGFDNWQYQQGEVKGDVRFANLEHGIPLEDGTVSAIRCHHVFEHIRNLEGLLKEIFRVAEDGCEVHFSVPHFTSNTFEFHVRQGFRRNMFKNFPEFTDKRVRLHFTGFYSFLNVVNLSWFLSNLYEYSFLRSFFFCYEVDFRAVVRK